MADCEFEFALDEPLDVVLARARQVLLDKGGTFEGERQGHYSLSTPLGDFRGTFTASVERLTFIVTERPFLVPCKTIERTLREKLFGDRDRDDF